MVFDLDIFFMERFYFRTLLITRSEFSFTLKVGSKFKKENVFLLTPSLFNVYTGFWCAD